MKQDKVRRLESALNYQFRDPSLLELALTHKSYFKGEKNHNNERLEFLGDAVLQIAISEYLFRKFPDLPEGQLAKIRAFYVSQPALAKKARKLGLHDLLKVGKGEKHTHAQERDSLLGDAYEAVLAAVYLDCGLEAAQKIATADLPRWSQEKLTIIDAKSTLQEHLQQAGQIPPIYHLAEERGPDHNKEFVVEVYQEDQILGRGAGKSKKEAAQNAARKALHKLDVLNGE